jgi:hypothetical protein
VAKVAKKIGRPTDDPKTLNTRIRLSEADQKKLDYCCTVFNLTKADVIRKGIDFMYEESVKVK